MNESPEVPRKKGKGRKRNWTAAFLKAFAETGVVNTAAQCAGVTRHAVRLKAKKDAKFAAAYAEALEESTERLEQAAVARAREGVKEPVWMKDENGKPVKVDEVPRMSDTLLIFLLKARRPEVYRERQQIQHTGPSGGPVEITVSEQSRKQLGDAIEKRILQRIEMKRRMEQKPKDQNEEGEAKT